VESEAAASPEKIYTVSEITRLIKLELETQFPLLWVEGEISGFRKAHSGHLYFTLKDEACQLHAVMFRSNAQRVPFVMEDGLQVVCRGQINVYEPRGQYQLMVEVIEPKGKGALQLAFEQLKEKLKKEGLFDPSKKKELPLLPKKVGIVTSPRGAAIIDILKTLERRFASLHLLIFPVKVQGKGASEEIVEGIDFFSSLPDIDVIIVGRGGGSIEDLWAFNEENVARAIHRCLVPVISAVGHEIDFTISDFVADIRASTPSVAAELLIETEQSFLERIENLEKRIVHLQQSAIQGQKHRVIEIIHHQAFQGFRVKLLNLIQRVDDSELQARDILQNLKQKMARDRSQTVLLEEKTISALKSMVQNLQGTWTKLAAELHNLSPLNILKKGFALCWKDDGRSAVLRIEEIKEAEEMIVSFYRGDFSCTVQSVDKERSIESRINRVKSKK